MTNKKWCFELEIKAQPLKQSQKGEGHSNSREHLIGQKCKQCRMTHQYYRSISLGIKILYRYFKCTYQLNVILVNTSN